MRRVRKGGTGISPWRLASRLVRAARDVSVLRTRLAELEQEIQECRGASKRLAEVMDVFVELLTPVEGRDLTRLDEVLKRYAATLEPARLKPSLPDVTVSS
jgi:hypothetical protein